MRIRELLILIAMVCFVGLITYIEDGKEYYPCCPDTPTSDAQ